MNRTFSRILIIGVVLVLLCSVVPALHGFGALGGNSTTRRIAPGVPGELLPSSPVGVRSVPSGPVYQLDPSLGAAMFPTTFTETGLPEGLNWSLTFNATQMNLTTNGTPDSLSFPPEPNGSYNYSIEEAPGYQLEGFPESGNLTISGTPLEVNLTYAPTYAAVFSESGLPSSNAAWYVNISGGPSLSNITNGGEGESVTAYLVDGNYTYEASTADPDYNCNGTGEFNVSGGPSEISIEFRLDNFSVSFSENGLPDGSNWSIIFYSGESSTTTGGSEAFLNFSEIPNGNYSYAILANPGYHQNSLPYSGNLIIDGAAVEEHLNYTQTDYSVTFWERGLPSGLNWSVTFWGTEKQLNSTSGTDSLSFPGIPNGTFPYIVADNPEYHQTSIAYAGNLVVNASSRNETLVYSAVTYNVTFSETGLGIGLNWSVIFSPGEQSLITTGGPENLSFGEISNGSWPYTILGNTGWHESSVPYTGVLVISGFAAEVEMHYAPVVFLITVFESGLPVGVVWYVNFTNGDTLSNTTSGTGDSTLSVSLPNGSYEYSVGTVDKQFFSLGGSFKIIGPHLTVLVEFLEVTYSVTFTISGLSSGQNWSVSLNGQNRTSLRDTILFSEPNGTYRFEVPSMNPAWELTPENGSLGVSGSNVTELIVLHEQTPAMSNFGLSQVQFYEIIASILILMAASVAVIFWTRRSPPEDRPDPPLPER